ncbi:MAG: chemotaxis protein CheD [Thermoguttaceae bacterium]
MRHVVGVGELDISSVGGDLMVTHALGSCLGIAVYDPVTGLGGLLHAMLPTAAINPSQAKINPCMFVDTGVPALLHKMLAAGATRNRLSIRAAGGAATQTERIDHFAIGKRNYIMFRKILWQFGLLLDAEDIGGELPRTMYLEIGTGKVWLNSMGLDKPL